MKKVQKSKFKLVHLVIGVSILLIGIYTYNYVSNPVPIQMISEDNGVTTKAGTTAKTATKDVTITREKTTTPAVKPPPPKVPNAVSNTTGESYAITSYKSSLLKIVECSCKASANGPNLFCSVYKRSITNGKVKGSGLDYNLTCFQCYSRPGYGWCKVKGK